MPSSLRLISKHLLPGTMLFLALAFTPMLMFTSLDAQAASVTFVVDKGSEAWTTKERQQLTAFIDNLPASLTQRSTTVLLYKNKAGFTDGVTSNGQSEQLSLYIANGIEESLEKQLLHGLLQRFDAQKHISNSTSWKTISGWEEHFFGLFDTANNQDIRAYADQEGLRSPADDFITSAGQYFLPPPSRAEDTIKCRTPRKYTFIKDLFPHYISAHDRHPVVCRTMDDGLLDDIVFFDPDTAKPINMGPINTQSVEGFELLYATPGTGDASEIAGHLLLRIRLNNNPSAKQTGIENPHDLVISFLANTEQQQAINERRENTGENTGENTVQLHCKKHWYNFGAGDQDNFDALQSIFQSLKGLSGGFLTIMDRQTLAQTLKNYTIEEDRNLLRYTLNLSPEQKLSLLTHLYEAKKSYKAKYYFFDQNCGSVLVKIIGQGIKDSEIAEFSPIVSPPNTLLGLFVRKGLASPTLPSFHSYRKQGHLAQQAIKEHYALMQNTQPSITFPSIQSLFDKSASKRLKTVDKLARLTDIHPPLNADLYELSQLIQTAEMVYEQKNLVCEDYTSEVTARARRLQRKLLSEKLPGSEDYKLETVEVLSINHSPAESSAFDQGQAVTQLLSYSGGFGQFQIDDEAYQSVSLLGSLEKQEMGSISNIAMQRGNYVKLGELQLDFINKDDETLDLAHWSLTALHIRKFKERLDTIPSIFSSDRSIGLGLSILDFENNEIQHYRRGALLGGEILFNLFATQNNDRHAFFSLGLDLTRHIQAQHSATAVTIPIHFETLWTVGAQRRVQWRNQLSHNFSVDSTMKDELGLRSELRYQLGRMYGRHLTLVLSSQYSKNHTDTLEPFRQSHIGIEFNHW